MKKDKSITVLRLRNRQLALTSRLNCQTLRPKLSELVLVFDEVTVTIQPDSFLEPISGHSGKEYCRIMLQSTPDDDNKVILG